MNIKNRIAKLEQRIEFDENSCRCGTPFKITFTIGEENNEKNVCPDCNLDVRMPSAKDFENGRVQILEPEVNFTREEFEAYQEKYVMSRHISWEQYLAQNREIR